MNGSASDDRPAVVDQVAKQVLGKLQDAPTAAATEQWQSMATAFRTELLEQVKDHVDGVTGALGARVMTLEGQVAGVEKKVESHGDMLKSMFQEQMSKIEELMAPKRARQE